MHKMSSLDNDINQHFQDAIDVIQRHSSNPYDDPEFKYYEASQSPMQSITGYPITHSSDLHYDWYETTYHMDVNHLTHVVPDVSLSPSVMGESAQMYSILPPLRTGKGRKKLRLYEYLHEALHDTNMVDSIQWTDHGSGTFHFISKNKEKLAECWGQRKGNRKTMTYQKMARALRNYSRTGEIVKVRRKLTYQFNPMILQRLGNTHTSGHPSGHLGRDMHLHHHHHHQQQHAPLEQGYYPGSVAPEWPSGYGHFPHQADCDLGTGFLSPSVTKV
ncbi:transcription factor Spi-C isoform X1 [Osmerus eperlanus]|uniref:transcription factor Spi-C isoform X1 n=1 Tax=Osmerus eperlanus TaxID=29151 RepID=UPI002E142589